MRNLLGKYVKRMREAKGLGRGELSRLMGYRNLQKGARRIHEVETGRIPDEVFLEKLIKALDLDREEVYECIETMEAEAEAAFQQWLDEPVPMQLILRYIPAVYLSEFLPGHILSEDAAIGYACGVAREKGLEACLVLNRRWSVWINSKGEVGHRSEATRKRPNIPSIGIKGGKRKVVMGIAERGKGLELKEVEEFKV